MSIEINKENFDAEVKNSAIPVLVDFWAPWCGPCRMLGPTLEEIADEFEGKVKVGKVNVDNERDLAVKYGISSIPALKLFVKGEVKKEAVGAIPKDRIIEMFN